MKSLLILFLHRVLELIDSYLYFGLWSREKKGRGEGMVATALKKLYHLPSEFLTKRFFSYLEFIHDET